MLPTFNLTNKTFKNYFWPKFTGGSIGARNPLKSAPACMLSFLLGKLVGI